MHEDRHPPPCPKCGGEMRVTLVVPRLGSHPELTSYTCNACNEVVTTVDGEP